jgi:hypothetical protein
MYIRPTSEASSKSQRVANFTSFKYLIVSRQAGKDGKVSSICRGPSIWAQFIRGKIKYCTGASAPSAIREVSIEELIELP